MSPSIEISAAVEGDLDEAVVRKLIGHVGGTTGVVYGRTGKPAIREKILGYNNAAKRSPWLVLVDLDRDAECAAALREQWLPKPARNLCFRIAVRQVESWLLADASRLADFLSVPEGKIPTSPDEIHNAKDAMVSLARQSRRSAIRQDMVPRPGSGRTCLLFEPDRVRSRFVAAEIGGEAIRKPSSSDPVSGAARERFRWMKAFIRSVGRSVRGPD